MLICFPAFSGINGLTVFFMTNSSFIVHIASFSAPASGKSFDLYTEIEEAQEYAKKYDETCIQVVDNDGYDVPSEISIQEYISFIDKVEQLDDNDKIKLKAFLEDQSFRYIDQFDADNIDLYDGGIDDLAEQFVDDGLYGEIPASIASYIDYSSIARDLSYDYTEMTIDGSVYCIRF